ncbi:YqgE/AlgH family protein [Primorskyibacter marinus]|uniref:YqgE/AlgH family protein n=1 Tax=Primorskyibacter marinus TaxID=1977320 RepID=UPI000E306236|nr:YqgE/AlgH family protein [Primorskyibacter marinus]
MTETTDLTGKLLIAMPGMGDPRFDRSVVFLCAHSDEGAMGLILNKPTPDVTMEALLDQLSIEASGDHMKQPVRFGGPVEQGRGFVLHSDEYESVVSTLKVPGGFAMTATLDILEDIGSGKGPERQLMLLGYAGWGPGQLESEIVENGWLTCEASKALVFDIPDTEKWEAALETLGVAALALSPDAGRA